ncbi:MAG: ComEC/Rec2 family competence protein, partial [Gammaproteobacteria bacterium]|nr:ComEC/Rec2 family competence protein [Gammaproteobacteria bacterium]
MQGIKIKQWYGAAFFSGNLSLWYGYATPHWLLLILLILIWVAYRHKATSLAVVFLLGFIYPLVTQLIDSTVLERLAITKHKYLLSGEIVSWVKHDTDSSRFTFLAREVNHTTIPDTAIQLTCYANCKGLKLGEHWQLLVKLSPAIGFANPAGFNYERWLFSNNIKARGYFIDSAFNQRLGENQGISALRIHLKQRLQSAFFDPQTQGGILAMLLGDRTLLDGDARQSLRATGTGHLIAISGLHVGLAGSMGYAIAVLVWRYASRKEHVIDKQSVAWSCAVVVALIYAIISGMGLPAQRALAMLIVFAISHVIGRHWSLGQRFNMALCVVIVLQPKAALDIGFWLSFAVTAILVIYVKLAPSRKYFRGLVILQLVLCISLSALQSLFFEQVALASVVYNLWAIPWVSIVLLPLSMVWLLLDSILFTLVSSLDVAHVLTWLVASVYGIFWWGLAITELAQHSLIHVSLAPVAAILMPIAVLCIRLASSWTTKISFVWLLAMCIFPRTPTSLFKMTVLDVGQGLAI